MRAYVCACAHRCGTGQRGWEVESKAKRMSLSLHRSSETFLDFTGGTEDKWISQVNKPVLKTF